MDQALCVSQQDLARFARGEQEAFAFIFDCLKDELQRIVRHFFRSPFDQEEAFQEVWLKIYRMRDRLDVNRPADLRAWAKQVARNRCVDLLRARGRAREVPVLVEELPTAVLPAQDVALARERLRQALAGFVSGLGEQEGRLFELCFVKEMELDEVARQLAVSPRRAKYLKKKLVARILRSPLLRRASRELV